MRRDGGGVAAPHIDAAAVAETEQLRERLREAEETLEAIRSGDVDAVVVGAGGRTPTVYTLDTADQTYRVLVEQMQEGALTLNRDGAILYCNRRLAELVGVPAERIVGALLERFIAVDDRELLTEMLRRGLAKGELRVRFAGERSAVANFSFSPLADHDDDDVGTLCCVVTDLTDQRRTGEALREAHERLLIEVSERERTETLLRQSQKMEAIGQLTGGVAHDFNNLLMVISGGLAMLDRQKDPARRERLLEGMRQAAQRGAGLTRQLLAFSRQQALRAEPIDLVRQVGGMRELLDRSLSGSVRVDTDFAKDLWPVCVDAGELEVVLLNLCVNARDAMPDGGVITLGARNQPKSAEDPRDRVRLSVTDTGTGMTAEVMARVFEPFYTTKEVGKGSGLGLAQAYGFANASDGEIRIESEPQRGTTILLLLPRSEHAPPVQESRAASQPCEREPNSAGGVLLVEDDEEVAALARDMLEQLGYRVTRVAIAKAALGALADGRDIDLVFSDVMMPGGMNGVEMAREVRRRRADLPIVLTSGYAEAVRREIQDEGLRLLAKPYRLEDLAEVIRST